MAGRNPYDRALSDLVGELSTRSDAFRTWWAAHNVRYHQTGTKRLHHPVVGDLELSYEVMELAADTELRLAIFTAEPGSHSEQALNLLASWAATPDQLPGEHPAADDARRLVTPPHIRRSGREMQRPLQTRECPALANRRAPRREPQPPPGDEHPGVSRSRTCLAFTEGADPSTEAGALGRKQPCGRERNPKATSGSVVGTLRGAPFCPSD